MSTPNYQLACLISSNSISLQQGSSHGGRLCRISTLRLAPGGDRRAERSQICCARTRKFKQALEVDCAVLMREQIPQTRRCAQASRELGIQDSVFSKCGERFPISLWGAPTRISQQVRRQRHAFLNCDEQIQGNDFAGGSIVLEFVKSTRQNRGDPRDGIANHRDFGG